MTLTGNTFYDGGPEQIYIEGSGRAGTNWEQPTAPLVRFNQNLTQKNNTFIGTAGQVGFYSYYKHSPSCSVPVTDMWQTFGSSFSSQSNTWGDTAATDTSYPFFDAAVLGATVPLSTWQSAPPDGVSQDSGSTFTPKASSPSPSQCSLPTPDAPDFWLVLGPRQGAAAIVAQAGGSAQVPLNLVSVGYSGTVSLSLDTSQEEGVHVTGVGGSFSPQQIALVVREHADTCRKHIDSYDDIVDPRRFLSADRNGDGWTERDENGNIIPAGWFAVGAAVDRERHDHGGDVLDFSDS